MQQSHINKHTQNIKNDILVPTYLALIVCASLYVSLRTKKDMCNSLSALYIHLHNIYIFYGYDRRRRRRQRPGQRGRFNGKDRNMQKVIKAKIIQEYNKHQRDYRWCVCVCVCMTIMRVGWLKIIIIRPRIKHTNTLCIGNVIREPIIVKKMSPQYVFSLCLCSKRLYDKIYIINYNFLYFFYYLKR